MKSGIIIFYVIVALAVSACGEIKDTSKIKTDGTSVGGQLVAGVGDTVLEVVNTESMPNNFGGADVFGRTRATGTTSLYFVGVQSGKAQFIRRDVEIASEKTTMNSSMIVIDPSSKTTYSGNFGGTRYSGTARTTAYPVFLPPNSPRDQVTGIRDLNISVSPGQSVTLAGQSLTVVSVNANQVTFILN